MIIDCHSHIWSSREELTGATNFSCFGPAQLEAASSDLHRESSEPADVSIVLGFMSKLLGVSIDNDHISSYISCEPDRLIGFAGIDPFMENAVSDLEKLKDDGVFAGIVLSPACQGFNPAHGEAMRLYEMAEDFAMPVYMLYGEKLPGGAVLENACPLFIDEVARTFPGLKIVISHLGFPWTEQTIALLAKHENVFADVAGLGDKPWQAFRSLNLAYEYGVIEKLLFASDFPNRTVKEAAEALYNLNKVSLDSVQVAVPREKLKGIVERDSLTLLGLNKVSDS